ncbi:hypothetical protein BGX34_000672 [Mortierella sp. NVP85]|nr:hypothetical protein BGX34_000672 [Mortierella sp. NVP85]
MSTAQVITPAPIASSPVVKSRSGRASVSTIVNVGVLKRHSVAYIPSLSWATKSMGLPSSGTISTGSTPRSPTLSTTSIATSVTSLFTGQNNSYSNNYNSTRRSLDKAAERDWKEQAKQVFQLSTVNAQGNFVPPHLNSLDKGCVDIEALQQQDADRDFDYFATTIVNTPPERVRTFLSTELTISPGMFSSPTKSRIKRHTISFPASPSPAVAVPVTQSKLLPPPVQTKPSPVAHTQPEGLNRRHRSSSLYESRKPRVARTTAPSAPSPTPVGSVSMPPSGPSVLSAADSADSNVYIGSSPPATPRPRRSQHSTDSRRSSTASLQPPKQEQQDHQKDDTKSHTRRKTRAQLSFLTGVALEEEDEESDALLDPFSSMMSSSPVDLVFGSRSSMDASSLSSSLASSPDMSPRRRSTILSSSSLSSFSPATVQKDKERIWKMNEQKLKAQNGF